MTTGRRWISLVFLLWISTLAWAIPVDRVPNPRETSGLFVEDAGGVLGPEYVSLIDGVCQALKSRTAVELAVVTVDDLEGYPIEEYALELFRRFGIGERGKDNGLLILFARDERQIRVEVGYGLEGTVTDAAAGQILDDHALPFFRDGLFGHGLYAAARALAMSVAASSGAELGIGEPAAWPAQVTPPAPVEEESPPAVKPNALTTSLIFSASLLVFILGGFLIILFRVSAKKARKAKQKALSGKGLFLTLMWIGAVVGFIVLASMTGKVLPLLLGGGLASTASTVGLVKGVKMLRRRVESYQASCSQCGRKMSLLDETADDALLTAEEIAEEAVSGMDYEIWKCPHCDATRRFAIKLGKAGTCPRCKRRTLVSSTTTLLAATRSHGGRIRVSQDCKNPTCDYQKSYERSTARLPSPSSSSRSSFSSSSRSSGSSFGGGRSGGGGATKSW